MNVRRPVQDADPYVSVVVPTLPDRDHSETVRALHEQDTDRYEVLVVEDGSIGVCDARNHGLEAAGGEVVAFTDDDCLPTPAWIEVIASRFESEEDLVVLEGRTTGGIDYDGRRHYPTCNLAVRRGPALDAGGFRSEYEYWREDTEFGWRMEDRGDHAYDGDMEVVHPGRPHSSIVESNERRLQEEYPERYEEILVPDTVLGRANNWLWRKGFWNLVDRLRYRGEA